eukprot:CAMPEP_0206465728 /NCGR_PEP_ID=MMETSP0324_2-20121206/28015_1 /ASSEMBLY_ACC=CAM_ASM_000836 /TAXON_ID=2866 /ORGANISM="Crypthecodinium cohnii, Strain Seligo" /LENGTH=404 /DNA_ID=CAMNT_0053938667 /DNA_START=15 /DNA_END=1229 /DNA_ORIENTATION=-
MTATLLRRAIPSTKAASTFKFPQRFLSTATSEEGSLVSFSPGSNGVAELQLCRPKKLNSLSMPMIQQLKVFYDQLEKGSDKCVLLSGEGRAFCAGGDVAEVRDGVLAGNSAPAEFFHDEYALDYQIATLHPRKGIVQVALWDGIVMGGGVGLSAHSPVRICTEKTMFAMPETLIGLFPDVGMTWKLSRLAAGLPTGLYLGLTGQRLGAADCMASGIATHYCPSEKLPQVVEKLKSLGAAKVSEIEVVAKVVEEIAGDSKPDTAKAVVEPNKEAIDRCFGNATTAEEIVARLQKENCKWSERTLKDLKMRSPTSVKVSLAAIMRHSGSVTMAQAFVEEYRMSQWCMRTQPESDFCEGIRAVLVDKDNSPNWVPPTLEEVSDERVQGFFAPLGPSHPYGELKHWVE